MVDDMLKNSKEIENEVVQRLIQVRDNPQMAYVLTMAGRIRWYVDNSLFIPAFEVEAYNEALRRAQKNSTSTGDKA